MLTFTRNIWNKTNLDILYYISTLDFFFSALQWFGTLFILSFINPSLASPFVILPFQLGCYMYALLLYIYGIPWLSLPPL